MYRQGRVPDGYALAPDFHYGVLWDAKIRSDSYSMGTDDRIIREYINSQSRDLKRKASLRNIYYAIISSRFADDYDDAISVLKMETDINEVCLIEAEAVVAMVDARLRSPLEITLGPLGLQRLFVKGEVLTANLVRTFVLICAVELWLWIGESNKSGIRHIFLIFRSRKPESQKPSLPLPNF
jgi:hypothetical protein